MQHISLACSLNAKVEGKIMSILFVISIITTIITTTTIITPLGL